MTLSVEKKHELLAVECERLASEQEKRAMNFLLTLEERFEAQEIARVYWLLAADHKDTIINALHIRPPKFTKKNVGPQKLTITRSAFIRKIWKNLGNVQHKEIVNHIIKNHMKQAIILWPDSQRDLGATIHGFIKRHRKSI